MLQSSNEFGFGLVCFTLSCYFMLSFNIIIMYCFSVRIVINTMLREPIMIINCYDQLTHKLLAMLVIKPVQCTKYEDTFH